VVDDAIIDVENIVRRLRLNRASASPQPAFRVVLDASLEVRSAVVYASVIVALVFLPVLFLDGLAGSFFFGGVDESGKVLAVEDVGQVAVTVGPGHSSSTILRLPSRLTGAWKDAVAPTILGAAAAAGIGTFAASGQPASPER